VPEEEAVEDVEHDGEEGDQRPRSHLERVAAGGGAAGTEVARNREVGIKDC